MGFNKVYKSLQEIFPQVDARALRAVAIEHSKDADKAVEAVLAEIIPFLTELSSSITPLTGSTAVGESTRGAVANAQTAEDCISANAAEGSTVGQNGYIENVGHQEFCGDANNGRSKPLCVTFNRRREGDGVLAALYGNVLGNMMRMKIDTCSRDEDGVIALQTEVSEPKTDKTTSDGKYPASSIHVTSDDDSCQTLGISKGKDDGVHRNVNISRERADNNCLEIEVDTATDKDSDQGKNSGGKKTCVVGPSSFIAHDITVGLPNNTASKMESTSIIAGTDDDSTLNGSMSQSSKIHMIEVLTKIIDDARNNKKMLLSAMDSIISLMREVKLKEEVSEQVKVEAAMGGTEILLKYEPLKQMLKQAEETNSMHAGEVYGEKAILATELRELQSRALSLSVERDKYLIVLDEMQETLKMRLAEAQNVIKSAEQEKIEKENAAMKSLTELELVKEKVLQEAKSLNQQAEDNAKLREFLMDRGHVVDTLQGEISVICQDVRLLKEKLDEHIPFSKSLSSSQTSFILASSGSSSKSLSSEQVVSLPVEGADPIDTQEIGVISSSTEHSSQDEAARDDRKALSDDDWEILDCLQVQVDN